MKFGGNEPKRMFKKEPHGKRKANEREDHQDPTKSSKRKKNKMEEIQHIVVVQKCKHPVLDGGARIEKLKRDSDVSHSLFRYYTS